MPSYQYLESLDSLRLRPGHALPERDRTRLQIFSDVLMSLALDRDVVVPQTFALDSFGFLEVARTVLAARSSRSDLDAMPRPFRLHLYGRPTYLDAVVAMLGRIDSPKDPFVSSLLPDLFEEPGRATAIADRIARTRRIDALVEWVETSPTPGVAEGLEAMWREFGSARVGDGRVVTPTPRGVAPSLPDAVEQLLRPSSEVKGRLAERGVLDHDGARRTLAALGELRTAARDATVDPFRNRSAVYSTRPWARAENGPTALDLVGERSLVLVQECVSTLYNMTVADSIGVAPAHFSTPVVPAQGEVHALAAAQELALGFIDGPGIAVALDSAGSPPGHPRSDARSAQAGEGYLASLRDKAADAFAAVLAAREDPRFTASAAALAAALATGDPRGVAAATEAHSTRLEGVLRDVAKVDVVERSGGSALRIGLTVGAVEVAANAAAVGASMVQDWPMMVGASLGSAGALGSAALFGLTVREVRQRRAHAREVRSLQERRVDEVSTALGRVVAIPAIEEHSRTAPSIPPRSRRP